MVPAANGPEHPAALAEGAVPIRPTAVMAAMRNTASARRTTFAGGRGTDSAFAEAVTVLAFSVRQEPERKSETRTGPHRNGEDRTEPHPP